MCYDYFVLWCVSGSKAHLACVWHEERLYTANPMLEWYEWCSSVMKSLGFHVIKPEWIYYANLCNFPCVQTLYKRTFYAIITSWLLTLDAQSTLHGISYAYSFIILVCWTKLKCSLSLLRLDWWKLVSALLLMLTELNAYIWNTASGWILCRSKRHLVHVSLMASHLICGQTNCYITVLQPVVNWVTSDMQWTWLKGWTEWKTESQTEWLNFTERLYFTTVHLFFWYKSDNNTNIAYVNHLKRHPQSPL